MCQRSFVVFFFFFNDTATTEIYTLSLHDALPISDVPSSADSTDSQARPSTCATTWSARWWALTATRRGPRSEEHTSELQSRRDLVCRLLLEKKKKKSEREYSSEPCERNTTTQNNT